jgi:hypothetical protein
MPISASAPGDRPCHGALLPSAIARRTCKALSSRGTDDIPILARCMFLGSRERKPDPKRAPCAKKILANQHLLASSLSTECGECPQNVGYHQRRAQQRPSHRAISGRHSFAHASSQRRLVCNASSISARAKIKLAVEALYERPKAKHTA